MMISSTLMGFALMLQRDPAEAPREAFAACLREFVNTSLNARKSAEAFTTEVATQCTTQEQAYRAAMIRRDTAARVSQADAERDANEEITYTRQQSTEMFTDANAPRT